MHEGETLAIVGESGSGKTMTALSVLRLVPQPPGRIVGGRILFRGVDLLQLSEAQMCRVRGRDIAMVFQDPMTAFDPLYRIGDQIEEAIEWHLRLDRQSRRARTIAALERVGIPAPETRARSYPHEFSGGMIQRAMIAMALACEPKLLIADEPTTALDVTMEAQIVDLLRDLQRDTGMGMMYVTHNMGVVARIAHRVAVMYAGTLVETGRTRTLFRNPKHPYTLGLMESVPRVDADPAERMPAIEGLPPDLIDMPDACPFAPRCSFVMSRCWEQRPPLREVGEDHRIACFANL
jgi:oligopeptide transport system ATP-binding protein